MPIEPPKPHLTEREDTDESLHVERDKTDEEVSKRQAIEDRSDAAVERTRGHADQVLHDSRRRADESLGREGSSGGQRRELRQERALADATLRQERLTADEELTDERRARMRSLAHLFLLEREQTDERLLVERARSDATLAARDDFMGMVAHDLRTLLGGISLSADLQIKNATDDEAGRLHLKAAERIRRYTARIDRLISDLVDVASIEGGRFTVAPRPHDANVLMRAALEAFQPAASAKHISLGTTSATHSLPAWFDHDRIDQVLANLLSNAIKFTGEGGEVSVHAESMGSEVRLSVTDTGAGIAGDHLESIFERFWQVSQGDRRGLGLGLFISKSIVEAHGGHIWAESEVGKGSTFSLTLPGAAPSDEHLTTTLH
ncbi:MAG TPA: HAMP domain-containing sensor histidine kinase [Anaeromyxobacteraceae bacterium]